MSKVILVVEDDQQFQILVRRMLQTSGYTIIEATDGKQGVELAITGKPDLIFMDILMPGIDGIAACHILKSSSITREIPIIMLTGVHAELSKDVTEKMGADGYVTKPFTRQKLLDVINQFLPAS